MNKLSRYRVPFGTAAWMILVPLVIAFFSGAGAGIFFDGLARMLGAFFAIYGVASIIAGLLLMLWVGWNVWRDGAAAKAVDG